MEEPDSAVETLSQIQEAFKSDALADYCLVSKKAAFSMFRSNLIKFCQDIIHKAAEQGILYENSQFMEDLKIWITSLSSSNLRSFRHTSTLIWLAIMEKLCELHVAATHVSSINQKIIEKENSKTRPNVARIEQAESSVSLANSKKEFIEGTMSDIFETVFVHRYRDVDFKIRVECMKSLGTWMLMLPEFFLESTYIRYFGWLLSDINNQVRVQVVRSLVKLYKIQDNISGFRQFTERFRSRIVEMSVLDSDTTVRAASIELLTILRELGFLENSDIEVICGLIFDKEARIRRAAAKFTLDHVIDESSESLNKFSAKDLKTCKSKFSTFDASWLAFKELAYVLKSQISTATTLRADDTVLRDLEELYPSSETRVTLAGEAIWAAGFESHYKWTALIDQLLFDFSSFDEQIESRTDRSYVELYSLEPDDENILVELLFGFIKGNLMEIDRHHFNSLISHSNIKKKRVSRDDLEAIHTQIQAELVDSIPKLVKHYSHNPKALSSILKLHDLLDLGIYRQLHFEPKYMEFIQMVIGQFKAQNDKEVLEECVNIFHKSLNDDSALSFTEEVRLALKDLLGDIGYEIQQCIISNPSNNEDDNNKEIEKAILEPTLKLDVISRVVDIQSTLELPLTEDENSTESNSETIIQKFSKIFSNISMMASENINLTLASSLINILKSYCMWKLSSVNFAATTTAVGNGTSKVVDLNAGTTEFITSIIQEFELVIEQAFSFEVRTMTSKALLDLLIAVNVTVMQVSLLPSSSTNFQILELPRKASTITQQQIMGIFLKKESAYAKSNKVTLDVGPEDSVYLKSLRSNKITSIKKALTTEDDSDSELSELSDSEDEEDDVATFHDNMEDGSTQFTNPESFQIQTQTVQSHEALRQITEQNSKSQQLLLLLECDLCQYAAKIRVAAVAKVIDFSLAKRIFLNAKHLSPLYNKVMEVNISSANEEKESRPGSHSNPAPGENEPTTENGTTTAATDNNAKGTETNEEVSNSENLKSTHNAESIEVEMTEENREEPAEQLEEGNIDKDRSLEDLEFQRNLELELQKELNMELNDDNNNES